MAQSDPKRRPHLMWTMEEIAREVGVSTKTVSRVVNGEAGVRDTTRMRVNRFIEEVGYHPHIGARSMRSQTRDCIGVTIPAPISDVPVHLGFFLRIFSHLYRIFGSRGRFVCFDLNPFHVSSGMDYSRGLFEGRYAGCVLCGPLSPTDTTIFRIHESGFPYLALGRLDRLPECSCATVDYEVAMQISVNCLVERGHKRIGVLKGFHGYQPGVERRRGFLKAMQLAGLEEDEHLLQNVTFGAQNLISATHRLLIDPTVTALIDASGAEDAASVREGCRRAGRVPGRDVDIVAWTYSDNAVIMSEACGHVWLPVWESAADGLEQLALWFDGEKCGPIQVVYPPTLNRIVGQVELPPPRRLFDVLE
ncbi:MAG: LacI family DNA-binding transcriptional regulator [Candidatus Hydrogenedentes bacterium]|nr:LacI family DNA-binding transcriptional regulator [Candidatus Hydrogenedentota bacterium]